MAKKQGSNTHYSVLKDALGTKTADAIVGVAREQAEDVFSANRAELTELAERVKSLAAQHGATEEVKGAAKVVADATREHNADQAKDEPSEADVVKDTERVEEATKVVDKAEADLAEQVARHEREIYDEDKGVLVRLDRLEESHSSLQTAIARATAIARSGDGGVVWRASQVALMLFGIVGIVYALVAWLSPLDYEWQVNAGLAFGAGALAGWIFLFWSGEGGGQASAAANAQARTGGRNDAGLDIVRPGQAAAAEALAEAGNNRSGAGANAAAH